MISSRVESSIHWISRDTVFCCPRFNDNFPFHTSLPFMGHHCSFHHSGLDLQRSDRDRSRGRDSNRSGESRDKNRSNRWDSGKLFSISLELLQFSHCQHFEQISHIFFSPLLPPLSPVSISQLPTTVLKCSWTSTSNKDVFHLAISVFWRFVQSIYWALVPLTDYLLCVQYLPTLSHSFFIMSRSLPFAPDLFKFRIMIFIPQGSRCIFLSTVTDGRRTCLT